MKQISAILIGAGARGREAYGKWGLKNKDRIKFIAVAEPQDKRRELFSQEWNIPSENQFLDWKDILSHPKMADACLICTPDNLHTKPALLALDIGYDVLLEKPMAPTQEECQLLVEKAETCGKQLRICHVARYTEFFDLAKKYVSEGKLGKIIQVQHSENVSYWHFPHGYVRGHWRREEDSSPIILAKTCHDLDLMYYIVGSPAKKVNSIGELTFFTKDNAPPGAPERCTDGCPEEETCPFFAPRLYMTAEPLKRILQRSDKWLMRFAGNLIVNHSKFVKSLALLIPKLKALVNWQLWPATVISNDLTSEGKMKALREGPYGKCVFHCDNNVPDHQVVTIEFENGVIGTMTLQGHSYLDGRWLRIDGSKGSLIGKFTYGGEELYYYDHRYVKEKLLHKRDVTFSAHGGGDEKLMESFICSLQGQIVKDSQLSTARASLESHLIGFAAEKSRHNDSVVYMQELRKSPIR